MALRVGELEVILAKAPQERRHRFDVNHRIGIEHDHVVEVGCHHFQAFYTLIDRFDEPAGRCMTVLGHAKSIMEARRGAERRERKGVLVRGNLVEQRN